MALVRLIFLGCFEQFAAPSVYHYIFLHIFHIFLDLKLIVEAGGAEGTPPPINLSILDQQKDETYANICKNI